MKDPIYRFIELNGSSTTSVEDAIIEVVQRAHNTVKNLCWFAVGKPRRAIVHGGLDQWQVKVTVGFTV